jgi:hypothetical protein
LSHFCLKLKDYPKWKKSFAAWYKDDNKLPEELTIDLEQGDGPSKTGTKLGPTKLPQS